MELTPYLETLRRELATAAAAGGEDARELAERLTAPLESAVRLALLDVLSTAAAEITRDLAPGSVDLRLRGREPSFVVTLPPTDDWSAEPEAGLPPVPTDSEESATARINFRLPEHLKARIEEAARHAGLSVNSWLVRAAAAALGPDEGNRGTQRRAPRGGQRYTGWVR
jgi:HicB-like protein involved in pilus formation